MSFGNSGTTAYIVNANGNFIQQTSQQHQQQQHQQQLHGGNIITTTIAGSHSQQQAQHIQLQPQQHHLIVQQSPQLHPQHHQQQQIHIQQGGGHHQQQQQQHQILFAQQQPIRHQLQQQMMSAGRDPHHRAGAALQEGNTDKPYVRGKTSPYGFFVKMCYEEHKKKYPNENVQIPEISKKCSLKWKTMLDNEKTRFFELAQKDSERYHAEVAAYGSDEVLRKRKRSKKDPNAPKRALSAFFFFSNEKRSEVQLNHPEWKVGQIAQELGRFWKALTEEARVVYDKRAADDKERYTEEMHQYRISIGKAPPDPAPSSAAPVASSAAAGVTNASLAGTPTAAPSQSGNSATFSQPQKQQQQSQAQILLQHQQQQAAQTASGQLPMQILEENNSQH